MYRELADVIETIRNAPGRNKSCALLIGAGCSVSAGIPLAKDIVMDIKNDCPQAYLRAEKNEQPRSKLTGYRHLRYVVPSNKTN